MQKVERLGSNIDIGSFDRQTDIGTVARAKFAGTSNSNVAARHTRKNSVLDINIFSLKKRFDILKKIIKF